MNANDRSSIRQRLAADILGLLLLRNGDEALGPDPAEAWERATDGWTTRHFYWHEDLVDEALVQAVAAADPVVYDDDPWEPCDFDVAKFVRDRLLDPDAPPAPVAPTIRP